MNFPYSPEKFVAALAFFASAGLRDLSKMKVAKLLYFCDKYHVLKYGTPVIGDQYFCMDHGPVPSASLNIMNDAMQGFEDDGAHPILDLLTEYVAVDRTPRYPVFTPKAKPDLSWFSGSELEALDATLKQYGQCSAATLRGMSHGDQAWQIADRARVSGGRADMPYSLFFEGQPDDVKAMLALMEDDAEQRQFVEQLTKR